MCERMTGSKSSGHPICAASSLELRPAAYFRASLISQLEIRATVRVQIWATGLPHETIFASSGASDAGTDRYRNHASPRRRQRCCGWTHRRSRCGDHHRGCGHCPTLLRTATGIRGTCTVLLLDARRAGVGWVPGRLDVPCCQSLRITRASITRASLERTTSCGSTTAAFQCPLLTQSGHRRPALRAYSAPSSVIMLCVGPWGAQ